MRLCRFSLDETTLAGFYRDDHVVPIDQACDAYCEAQGVDLLLPSTEDLLDLLPPDGESHLAAQELAAWVEELDEEGLAELAIPIDDVTLLVPIPRPNKILLLAGNYAEHVVERGGVAAERGETFPYVFLKPPSTTLTNPFDPDRDPQRSRPTTSTGNASWASSSAASAATSTRPRRSNTSRATRSSTTSPTASSRRTRAGSRASATGSSTGSTASGTTHSARWARASSRPMDVDDPQDLRLRLTVNGEVQQDGSTGQMVFPVAAVVAFISSFVTLEPGDVISTGTPKGVGSAKGTYLKPGDVVVASIEGIGALENPVVAED